MLRWFSIIVAFASGYISLSYEILWYRTYSFVTWSTPSVFVLLLTAFLMGIAMGARRVKALCNTSDRDVLRFRLALMLLAGNIVCISVIPLLGLAAQIDWRPTLGLVLVGAGLLGSILPLLGEIGIEADESVGMNVAYLYIGNIIGSSLGSALTGFVLMDRLSTASLSVVLGVLGFIAAALVSRDRRILGAAVVGALALIALRGPMYGAIYERLLYKETYAPEKKFKRLVENRHGVIAVAHDDQIYGGGAYDGAFNTSLSSAKNAKNNIHRAVTVEALRTPQMPAEHDMLSIGLASGSWAQVLVNLPSTESLTIIEINPGYLDVIRDYPAVAGVLSNPKVKIEIDDARRWLQRHPERTFDVIVMNTTFSWRAQSTNITSVEFLQISRAHLRPGGIHYFNSTWSTDLMRTAFQTFPYGIRAMNCVGVSDSPITFDQDAWERALKTMDGGDELRYREFGASLDKGGDPAELDRLETRESVLARIGPGPIVTDDNMVAELRHLFVYPGPPSP